MKKIILLLLLNMCAVLSFAQRSTKSYDTSSDTYWFEKSKDDVLSNENFYLEHLNYYDYFYNSYRSNKTWRGHGYNGYNDFRTSFHLKSGIYQYVDWKVFKAVDFMIYYTDSVVSSYSDSAYQLAIDSATVLSTNAFESAMDSATILSKLAQKTAIDSATVLSNIAFESAVDSATIRTSLAQDTAIDSASVLSNNTFQSAVDSATILSNFALQSAIDSTTVLSDLAQQTAIDSAIVLSNNVLLSAVDSATILSAQAQQTAIDSATVMYSTLETQLTAVVNDSLSSLSSQLKAYTDSVATEIKIDGITVDEVENIGMGMTPKYKLDVNGTIRATKILVEANGNTADFVFADNYKLKDLKEVEEYVKEHKHLEGIASAEMMETQGVNLAEMNKLLLQKVEELTLYVIKQQQESQKKNGEIAGMKNEIQELKSLITKEITEH